MTAHELNKYFRRCLKAGEWDVSFLLEFALPDPEPVLLDWDYSHEPDGELFPAFFLVRWQVDLPDGRHEQALAFCPHGHGKPGMDQHWGLVNTADMVMGQDALWNGSLAHLCKIMGVEKQLNNFRDM